MRKRIQVPVKDVNGVLWGDLTVFGQKHEMVAEYANIKDSGYPFAGQHRVRLTVLKKNVHWKVQDFQSVLVDISGIPPQSVPRRQGAR